MKTQSRIYRTIPGSASAPVIKESTTAYPNDTYSPSAYDIARQIGRERLQERAPPAPKDATPSRAEDFRLQLGDGELGLRLHHAYRSAAGLRGLENVAA